MTRIIRTLPPRTLPVGQRPSRTRTASAPFAVFIDGSALFLASKTYFPDQPLDYRELVSVLCAEIPQLNPPDQGNSGNHWVMWTSAAGDNPGQTRFLDFAEKELLFTVRRFPPATASSLNRQPSLVYRRIAEQSVDF